MQKSFKKFKKIPFIASTLLLLLSLFIFYFIYKNIQDNNTVFDAKEAEWQQENSKKDELKSLSRVLKTFEPERALLDSHFIKSSDVVPFLDTVEKLAGQVKATAEVTSVDITTNNTNLVVGVKATGTFESIYKFLTLLENSPYQLEIISMGMLANDSGVATEKTGTKEWSAVFKIRLLSFIN